MTALLAVAVASLELLRAAMDPTSGPRSYTASATFAVHARLIAPIRQTFHGTAYALGFQRAIVFDGLPPQLRRFRVMHLGVPSYEAAQGDYVIEPGTDDGTSARYTLVPKRQDARVSTMVISVDPRERIVTAVAWKYRDGSSLSVRQQYGRVDGYRVPVRDTLTARFPGYSVDGELQFRDFAINVDVPPAVFANEP